MITNFGWRSAIAVFINALLIVIIFKDSLKKINIKKSEDRLQFLSL